VQEGFETIKERDLGFLDSLSRFGEGEELRTIHFGKILEFARAGRPFEGEGVALEGTAIIHVLCDSPGVNGFSALLADRAEIQELAFRIGFNADLLLQLANGGRKFLVARLNFTLGNRPMAEIFAGKERTARVGEEYFEFPISKAIKDKAGANFRLHAFQAYADFCGKAKY